MHKTWYRTSLVSLLLILSSLAGCLDADNSEETTETAEPEVTGNGTQETVILGTVMVSTYHVEQLVSAIVGDSVNVEVLSPSNVPVHDYTPGPEDLVRLQEVDVFFYHGLNLEPWVADTISTLGSNAPSTVVATHAMPSGEIKLDYESLLITKVCEQLSEGDSESTTLAEHESGDNLPELHAEHITHRLSFPADMDDDHDDHNETDDHDDHGDHEDEMEQLMSIFNESDANNDSLLNLTELENFIHEIDEFEDGHEDHDDHGDHNSGYAKIHIEAEGEYGFLLPMDVEFYILMDEDSHDDHAGHGHDDHAGHGHDDHGAYEVIWYHMDGCDVCVAMSPEWDKFVEDNPEITTSKVESQEAGAIARGITAFPTVLLLDGNGDKIAEGNAELNTAAALELFYEENIEEDEIAAGEGEEAFKYDPHSWLDPLAFKAQINAALEHLITAFPSGESTFRANAENYTAQLDMLHADFEAAFSENGTCTENKEVVANHNAYAYLALRYDIEFLTVHGLDPEGEPSPADIAKVVEHINEKGLTVLFVEEYTNQGAISSIVKETGVTIKILYTMELPPDADSGETYLSMMSKNLENLVSGMGC